MTKPKLLPHGVAAKRRFIVLNEEGWEYGEADTFSSARCIVESLALDNTPELFIVYKAVLVSGASVDSCAVTD